LAVLTGDSSVALMVELMVELMAETLVVQTAA
jgi:hypothetical protein